MTHRLPLAATIAIGIQMVMGGLIVGKDAGFVCPDWPLCHHQIMPALTPLLALELVHRLSAIIVLVLVSMVTIIVFRRHRQHKLMVRLVVFSLLSLLLQIVVGGLIVVWKLPGVTTTIDVANSMVLLSLYIALTVLGYRQHRERIGQPVHPDGRIHALAVPARALLAATGIAVVAGAVFRHTGASQALFGQISYLASHGQHTPPTRLTSETMLLIHAMTGALLGLTALWFLVECTRRRRLIWLSGLILGLVIVQAVLGVWSLATELALIPTTIHWGTAALLTGLITFALVLAEFANPNLVREKAYHPVRVPEPNSMH